MSRCRFSSPKLHCSSDQSAALAEEGKHRVGRYVDVLVIYSRNPAIWGAAVVAQDRRNRGRGMSRSQRLPKRACRKSILSAHAPPLSLLLCDHTSASLNLSARLLHPRARSPLDILPISCGFAPCPRGECLSIFRSSGEAGERPEALAGFDAVASTLLRRDSGERGGLLLHFFAPAVWAFCFISG